MLEFNFLEKEKKKTHKIEEDDTQPQKTITIYNYYYIIKF